MKWPRPFWAVIFYILLMSGCASRHYERTQPGQLNGKIIVEWRRPDLFAYRPDTKQPLMFLRKSGEEIKPGLMFTDGGSIPRSFWVLKNYSPWGYGPAFIVHDWLFHMQNCKLPGYAMQVFGRRGSNHYVGSHEDDDGEPGLRLRKQDHYVLDVQGCADAARSGCLE